VINSHLLYQLSYSGKDRKLNQRRTFCNRGRARGVHLTLASAFAVALVKESGVAQYAK
jgi:hypothetical protein